MNNRVWPSTSEGAIFAFSSGQPYLVSARKYRPQAWDAGGAIITQTLQQSIASGQIAQAYLFCGPRGVGKTTSARIFARAINGFDVQDEAMSFNVFELDAASSNKVEDFRSIVDPFASRRSKANARCTSSTRCTC